MSRIHNCWTLVGSLTVTSLDALVAATRSMTSYKYVKSTPGQSRQAVRTMRASSVAVDFDASCVSMM
jgi:hypothetical protein